MFSFALRVILRLQIDQSFLTFFPFPHLPSPFFPFLTTPSYLPLSVAFVVLHSAALGPDLVLPREGGEGEGEGLEGVRMRRGRPREVLLGVRVERGRRLERVGVFERGGERREVVFVLTLVGV